MIAFVGRQDHFDNKMMYSIEMNNTWIELPCHDILHEAVKGHADMVCCPVEGKLVAEPTTYARLLEEHPGLSDKLIKGQGDLSEKYPANIAYNVALIGKYAIHNTQHTDPVLKAQIDNAGYTWIHTKQGYANCMLLKVGADAAVTSDAGLARTLRLYGIDVLLIRQGGIELPGFDYGFIGGASFTYGKTCYFFGELETHPDADRIKAFLYEHNRDYKAICPGRLFDIGSVRILE